MGKVSVDTLFYPGGTVLALALLLWVAAVWRGYRFAGHPAFRSIPFFLVIALFALAFNSEHLG